MARVPQTRGHEPCDVWGDAKNRLIRDQPAHSWHRLPLKATHPSLPVATDLCGIAGWTGSDCQARTSGRGPGKPGAGDNGLWLPVRHLTETDVARRWRMSVRTLQAWRWRKVGPPYIKAMGRVLYRLSDIETFEAEHLRGGR